MSLKLKFLTSKILMSVRVMVFYIFLPFIFLLTGCERIPHENDIALQDSESSGKKCKCSVGNFSVADENKFHALSERWVNTDELFKIDNFSHVENKKYLFNLDGGGSGESYFNWTNFYLCNKAWIF